MNVEVESLPNCIASLKVEVPSDKVTAAWTKIAQEYKAYARIPGYRPGKAPQAIIDRKFGKEIKDKLTETLVDESFREAIKTQNLRVLQINNVEDVEIAEDKTMRFSATVVTQPEFELPEYKGIVVRVPSTEVTEADLNRALVNLQEQNAEFVDVTGRGAEIGDFAIIDYTGTVDGKPVEEVAPKAGKVLSGNTGFWIKLGPDSFFKGFTENLTGAVPGDVRTFSSTVPEDFPAAEVANLTIDFTVTVKELKTQTLPPLDDSLAAKILPNTTFDQLKELLSKEISLRKESEVDRMKRDSIMNTLLSQVECELPDSMVRNETQRVLANVVDQNKKRGITDEALKEKETEIVANAGKTARDRLKGAFILNRIAEQEKITVTREEFQDRVSGMAEAYKVSHDKMEKELVKRDAISGVREEILMAKVLDFLVANATVENVSEVPVSA